MSAVFKIITCSLGIGLLLIAAFTCHAADSLSTHYHIIYDADENARNDEAFDAIERAIPAPINLEHTDFQADVRIHEQEFLYLTDLREGRVVNAQQIKQAVYYLQKKKIFKTIVLDIDYAHSGIHLSIKCEALWTFAKLKIHGVILGKDAYRRYYLMEPGDPFNETKHIRSLERIKDALCQAGYHANTVITTFKHDEATKTITVHIRIHRGKRFSIGKVSLVFCNDHEAREGEYDALPLYNNRNFLQHLEGTSYSRQFIAQEASHLRNYLFQQGFLNVAIRMTETIEHNSHTAQLTFTVKLNARREFIFVGNNFFNTAALLDAITVFGRSTYLLPASALSQEIIRLYHSKGFFDVIVETKEDALRSFFLIREGRQASLGKVTLNGCEAHDASQLIKTYFSSALKATSIDQEVIDKALENVLTHYMSTGFLDAQIIKQEWAVIDDDRRTQELKVLLDEGPLCTIASARVEGMPEFDEQGPFMECNQGHEVPFSMDVMRQQREWLITQLKRNGRTGIDLKPHVERSGTTVTVVWRMGSAGTQTSFGKTIIVGAHRFPFECIMRELDYKEGDLWNRDKLKISMQRLRALEIFDGIQLHPDSSDASDKKVILAKLQMDDPCEVRTRAGLGLQQVSKEYGFAGLTYRAGGTFIFKNPFNVGDQFSCDLNMAKSDMSIVAAYRRPWIFGLPLRTVVQVHHAKQNHPGIIKSSQDLYQVSQQGLLATISHMESHRTLGVNIGLEYMETRAVPGQDERQAIALARAINFEPQLLDKKIPYFLFEPTILIDRLDNKVQPTQGTFTLMSLKAMIPLCSLESQAHFIRFTVEQSFFIPISTVVFAARVRFGHIFYRLFRTIMPAERFYLGGAHSIRSYETDLAPPQGIYKDDEGKRHCVPRGGKSMVNINLEIRMPLYKQVGLVVFQDLGALSCDHLAAVKREDILTASGFGLRYNTLFGPLRFDIGWKWRSREICDHSYAWFLALGQAF